MIYLNIGSNLESSYGNRFKNIELAINLMKNENIFVKKKSSFFETPSYPDFKKPKFINVCLEVEYENSPLLLLKSTLSIEKKVERIRREKNEPRTVLEFIFLPSNIFFRSPKYKNGTKISKII